MPRHFRRRRMVVRPSIQSQKVVINHAAASFVAGTIVQGMSVGTDSVAAGQTGPTNTQVPTGSRIAAFNIRFAAVNIVGGALFLHIAIQLVHNAQTVVDPQLVGGNPQRNQVFYQDMRSIGINQNMNWAILFKIPKRFQRVREGDRWEFVWKATNTVTATNQIIYKYIR